jgi:hypothetical protein
MEIKEFWKSKTLWIGVALPVLIAFFGAIGEGKDAWQAAVLAMAALSLALRKFTTKGIVFALKAPQPPPEHRATMPISIDPDNPN